ncbi:aminotransferase class I/II-fold pyridoxal phosphate-dependent enzyme [Neolewinella persica]|uniref:aminotransferase class I/II-fold pyridoxal phosphate-dependent enzyme n=1 Tax=Neolewinella persica TaxID=70998 RepID=UPI00036017E8|nr:aminotransferase class I/II-fold pyridoxal phosphate-dependent enzyme [Neolewinella persica]
MADFINNRLDKIRETGNYRKLAGTVEGIDFWSNDYLGLARPQVQSKVVKGQGEMASPGPTGSRSISGDADDYHAIEQKIADYHGFSSALVFNSGYTANLGLLSSLLKRNDVILYDELIHASCRDGIRLGLAKAFRFSHNNLENSLLSNLGKVSGEGQLFVLTEGRFSMDGDLAPLIEIAGLCEIHGAHLIVDEAHSGGVDGPYGAGLVARFGLQDRVFASIITYGKAFGAHGAAVLGDKALKEYLANTCRPFIYTTGPAPAQWLAISGAYARLQADHEALSALLGKRIQQFNSEMEAAGLSGLLTGVEGPIQVISVPGNQAVMAAETACREAGLLVKGIRSPTVAAGSERLRICLHAFNTEVEVERLVTTLKQVLLQRQD